MDGADVASLRCHLTRPGINYKAIAECGWITTTMKISCIGSQNGKCDEQNKREKNAVEQKVKEMKLNLFFFLSECKRIENEKKWQASRMVGKNPSTYLSLGLALAISMKAAFLSSLPFSFRIFHPASLE